MVSADFDFDDDASLDRELSEFSFDGSDIASSSGGVTVLVGGGKARDFQGLMSAVSACAERMASLLARDFMSFVPDGILLSSARCSEVSDKRLVFELSFDFSEFKAPDLSESFSSCRDSFKARERVLFACLQAFARRLSFVVSSVRESFFLPNVTVSLTVMRDPLPSVTSAKKDVSSCTVGDLFALATFDDTDGLNRMDDPLASLMGGKDGGDGGDFL